MKIHISKKLARGMELKRKLKATVFLEENGAGLYLLFGGKRDFHSDKSGCE